MNEKESAKMPLDVAEVTSDPIKAWFLGPRCENSKFFLEQLTEIFQRSSGWRTSFTRADKSFYRAADETTNREHYDTLQDKVKDLLIELNSDFPFYSPHYIGHMLSETTIPAMLGYFAGMLRNSNNVTPEAAARTVGLELEVGKLISTMLGFDPQKAWMHICSGGTIANLEALWVARAVQWLPPCLKEICLEKDLDIPVFNPNRTVTSLKDTSVKVLLSLGAERTLALADEVKARCNIASAEWFKRLAECKSNPRTKGIYSALHAASIEEKRFFGLSEPDNCDLSLTPIIFVSAAAHYSISKAAQILGYGESAVRYVPVDSRFRINLRELKKQMLQLRSNEYIAAVIGILGTTEEGAVDPAHEILALRDEAELKSNQSFWLHLDAAWGGYFATMFNKRISADVTEWQMPVMSATVEHELFKNTISELNRTLKWDESEVLKAFPAMKDADSVTIDPHKTGYIPYPAGMILFKDSRVKPLLTQRAQYIASEEAQPDAQESFAPYIIEGSKPGAAAAACWLAHKAIPLDSEGHGRIMRECILNAQKLAFYLTEHKAIYDRLEKNSNVRGSVFPFTFVLTCHPDTNVVTFVAVPTLTLQHKKIQPVTNQIGKSVKWLNELNKRVYQEFSITVKRESNHKVDKDFFISHTTFSRQQYSAESLKDLLSLIDVSPEDYDEHGLCILRATVMNPFYRQAEQQNDDLLLEFVRHLHAVVREKLRESFGDRA